MRSSVIFGVLVALVPVAANAQSLHIGAAFGPGSVTDARLSGLERSMHAQLDVAWAVNARWSIRADALYSRWSAHENIVCTNAGVDLPARCQAETDEHDRIAPHVQALYRIVGERVVPYVFAGAGIAHDRSTMRQQRQCIPGTLCDQPPSSEVKRTEWESEVSAGGGVELGRHVFVELQLAGMPGDNTARIYPLLIGLRF